MMKRALHILLLFFVTLSMTAATTKAAKKTWCVLNLADGTSQAYLIPGRLNVIPDNKTLRLISSCIETTYDIDKVKSYTFYENELPNSISQTTLPSHNIIFTSPDQISISGINDTQRILVFSTNGTQYSPTITRLGSSAATISLSSLPHGIYLISIPASDIPPFKVVKR